MDKVKCLLAEYDAMCESASSGELEEWMKRTCARYDEENSGDFAGRATLYNELGSFYRHRGILDKGETAFCTAKTLLEMSVQPDGNGLCEREKLPDGRCGVLTADYATTLNNLAGLYRMAKRFEEAEDLFAQAESIYRADKNTPEDLLASCRNNLGLVYMDQGRWAEAMDCFESAIAILRSAPEKEYERATTDGNMAVALARLGRTAEAKTHLAAALEAFSRLLGPDSEVCRGLANLAGLLDT